MGIELIIFAIDNTLIQEGNFLSVNALDYISSIVSKVKNINKDFLIDKVQYHAENLWKNAPYYTYFKMQGIEALDGLFLFFENNFPTLTDLQEWSTYFRIEAWRLALLDFGIDDPDYAEEVAVEFLTTNDSRYRLFPDALTVLDELVKRGFRLAIITNGQESLQMEKLITLNLEKYFETIVIAENIGYRKPDKRIFTFLLERLEVAPENALMVGSSFFDDIAGAKKSGIKSVWMTNGKREQHPDIKADFIISALHELIKLLTNLR